MNNTNRITHRPLISHFFLLLALMGMMKQDGYSTGWNDFSFDIDSKYMVLRANSLDIHIWQKKDPNGGIDAVTSPQNNPNFNTVNVGPLYELSVNDQYIFAKCHGLIGEMKVDTSVTHYFIINRASGEVIGPGTEESFQAEIIRLGFFQAITWQTLRQAHKQSMRDGRGNPNDPDTALFGQLISLAFSLPFTLPIFSIITLLPGLGVAAFVRAIAKLKGKNISFRKPLIISWGTCIFLCLFYLISMMLYNWFDMKFLYITNKYNSQ